MSGQAPQPRRGDGLMIRALIAAGALGVGLAVVACAPQRSAEVTVTGQRRR